MSLSTPRSNDTTRYIIRGEQELLRLPARKEKMQGLFLITDDELGIAKLLADTLLYCGAFAYVVEKEHYLTETAIRHEVESARRLFGPVTGIIHLAGLKAMPMPEDMERWHDEVQSQCKSLFYFLQLAGRDLERKDHYSLKRIICCTILGGHYGRDGSLQPGLPIAGGGQGLLRSLEYEWDHLLAKTIDFDLSLVPEEMASIIFNELRVGGGKLEIGYPKGKRTVFSTYKAPLSPTIRPAGLVPLKNQVILATGGARGITAETIKMFSNEDNQYILVGRTELLDKMDYLKYLLMDAAQLRRTFIAESRGSNMPDTPRIIESRIARIIADREIRTNIAALRRTGSKVAYIACNVTDPVAFGNLLDALYRDYGKIDIVFHGAGVIEDHLLTDKSASSFNRVFNTKVDSAFILYKRLKWATVRCFVAFASTAGRFGNKGQSDYAAANEVLNRLAWRIWTEWPHVLVKSLNWGPWSGIGMANDAINEQFISKGIVPISKEEGVRYFVGELLHGDPSEVEVILGDGTWNPDKEDRIQSIFNISSELFNQ